MTITGPTCTNPAKSHEPFQYAHDNDPLSEPLDSGLPSSSIDTGLYPITGDVWDYDTPSFEPWDAIENEVQLKIREAIKSYRSGTGQVQSSRVKRRLSLDPDEEDAHAYQKRARNDDTHDNDANSIPTTTAGVGSLFPVDVHSTSSSSTDSQSSTAVHSPDPTLPPATPDDKTDAELAVTPEEIPDATVDASEDKEPSFPTPSATEDYSVDIHSTSSAAPGAALLSMPVSANSTAPAHGAVGPSVNASAPAPIHHHSVTTRDVVPVVYNGPPGALAATVGVMPNMFAYPIAIPPQAMLYHNMVPLYYPPPAMVAPMVSAALPFTVPAAPVTAAVPQAPPVAVHPVQALHTITAPAAAAAEPAHALWERLVTTLNTTIWNVDHTLGYPIDDVLIEDYLVAFRTSDRYAVVWNFSYSGNPHATPPRGQRDIQIVSVLTANLHSYDGMQPVNGLNYRIRMLQAWPYLTIRALEQGKFEYVFHCNVNGDKWCCPHCGKTVKQEIGLTKHFERCQVLRSVENQVRAANN